MGNKRTPRLQLSEGSWRQRTSERIGRRYPALFESGALGSAPLVSAVRAFDASPVPQAIHSLTCQTVK